MRIGDAIVDDKGCALMLASKGCKCPVFGPEPNAIATSEDYSG